MNALNRCITRAATAIARSHAALPAPYRAARLGVLVLPLLVALSHLPARADAVATVIPVDGLRLRAAPATDQRVLDLIPGGTRIPILGQATADGWYQTVYRGRRGWVNGQHLAFDDGAAARRATVIHPDGLNLRAGPLETADVLTVLPGGAVATVTGRATADGWSLVPAAERTGWASSAYLAVESPPASVAFGPAPAPSATFGVPPAAATGSSPTFGASTGGTRVTLTYYHPGFEGSRMYCGGVTRADDPTIAATNTWPCGTVLRVCRSGACITVTVRDKGGMGPNHIDLSAAGFARLGTLADMTVEGTAEVVP